MTKEELKRISVNNNKLARLKERYAMLRLKSQAKGQVLTGMPHISGISDTVGDYVGNITELREEILLLEMETEMLVKRARRFIASIPDVTIQAILEYKYINNIYPSEIIFAIGNRDLRNEKDLNRIVNTFFLDILL